MDWGKITSKEKIWDLILKFFKEKRKLNPDYIDVQDNHIGYLTTDGVHTVLGFMPIDDRFLFDFFDDQGIRIWFLWDDHLDVQWWHTVINTSFSMPDSRKEKETHSSDWDVPYWKERSDAEEVAWLKAFEILENHQNEAGDSNSSN